MIDISEAIEKGVKEAAEPLLRDLIDKVDRLMDLQIYASQKDYRDSDLLTVDEVAKILPVAVDTLNKWRSDATHIEFIKVGGKVVYEFRAIKEYVARNRVKVADRGRGV